MRLLKKVIARILQIFGYEIHKIIKQQDEIATKLLLNTQESTTSNNIPDIYFQYYPKESINEKKFYNIGAGTFRHPYWTNIDLASDWYAESQIGSNMINYDLFSLKPLPIPDNHAEVVYTSHTVEHINNEAAQNMFDESYRILKKGGVFRLTTPDIDLYYKACMMNDRNFYWWIDLYSTKEVCEKINIHPFNQFSLLQVFLFSFATHVSQIVKDNTLKKFSDNDLKEIFQNYQYNDALNFITSKCTIEQQRKYFGYHMNWWNWEKAEKMLKKAGFKEIYKSGFGQSVSPCMRDTVLFDKQDPKDSLYVEAVK